MAKNTRKSQAERAAEMKNKGKKNSAAKTNKPNPATKPVVKPPSAEIPARLISSVIFLALFVLFLIMSFVQGGIINNLLKNLICGLIGKTAFVVSIPALLYLFIIHAFSGERPVKMRTICLCGFVLVCGMISHLGSNGIQSGAELIPELYLGGIAGSTGGLICGGLAMLMTVLFNKILTYIILVIAALLLLLAGMQITIPSVVRAIRERPRPEWDDEEQLERQEPAAIVVNHIANKRIEYLERRRQMINDVENDIEDDEPAVQESHPVKTFAGTKKAKDILSQIDSDVEEPVAASNVGDCETVDEEIIPLMNKPNKAEVQDMPLFIPDEVTPQAVDIDLPVADTKKEKVTAKDAEQSAAEVAQEIAAANVIEKPEYCFPPVDLLKLPSGGMLDGTAEMRENSRRLNETLASFKIEAHIINVTRGPSVTRYEVELEKGVRLNKLTTAADDIALSLGASGVRIAAVPGKISVVGIEVPNRAVTTVSLREVIDSNEFNKAKSKSSFAVGKDIGGSCIVGNIAKLPHMLIAGTTGSGKSVCMNSIIISLLYKASPDDVKLIMVDPKMVELGIYNGIPHLLIPVVTDPKKAAGSLQWAVTEMMRRYKSMSDAGVRDLESYNSIIDSQEVDGVKLPQIVVIIDELADLMLVAAKEVEESICRIAQMGRAAGIHLVIATQRPSADVITGLMKANIPSRIAFAVASAMESRIILDTQGAEKLVGKGDMLFAPIGTGKPTRVQGCFVSDSEVEAIASYVKANYVTNYDQGVMEEIEKKALQTGNKATSAADPEPTSDEMSGDEMLPAAVDVILETGQASVSMLQRRLKLGYARAARIVDEMEERGIVGPFVGSKPRAILVTKEQWETMRSGQPAQLGFDDLGEDSLSE